MHNHIILEPAHKIREIARNYLAGYWKQVVLGIFIYWLFTSGISQILNFFFSYEYQLPMDATITDNVTYRVGYGGTFYTILVNGPLAYGLSVFLLTFFRSKKADSTLIFEGFSHFAKCVWLMLVILIKTFLWGLLFVIPGIIAGYRYSQAFYVMVDHPEYTVSQCIEESKRLMEGNKGRLFYLELTFIGWFILASIAGGIFDTFNDGDGFVNLLVSMVFTLPVMVVNAYVEVSHTVFYELATERLIVVNSDNHTWEQ